jgi:hypothetical protein
MDTLTKHATLERRARLKKALGREGDSRPYLTSLERRATKALPDAGIVQFVAMTEAVDMDDDVVLAGGVDRDSYFFTNKSVFVDHAYDLSNLIGKARRIIPRPSLDGVKQWDVHVRLLKDHPHSASILELAEEGLIGSSIGFAAKEFGPPSEKELAAYTSGPKSPRRIVRSWEWLEQSITAIPANVEAQAIGHEAAKHLLLEGLVSDGRISRDLAGSLGAPEMTERSLWPVAETPAARKRLLAIVVEN